MDQENQISTEQPQGPLTNYELKNSKVDLLGQKNVSLDPSSSAEIRMKLMQMIQEREAKKNGWGDFIDTALALSGDPVNFNTDWNNYQKNKRERDLELMQMYSSVGQLDTEEKRIQMMREQEAARRQMIEGAFNPQGGNSPIIAQNQQAEAFNSRLARLPAETQKGIKALLLDPNPQVQAKGWEQYIAATKPTEFEDKLRRLNLSPEQERAFIAASIYPNVGNLTQALIPGDDTNATRNIPALEAIQQTLGTTPFDQRSGLSAVSPSPTQPQAGGLEAVAPAPAPAPAPQQSRGPAPAPQQSRGPVPVPQQSRVPAPAPAQPRTQAPAPQTAPEKYKNIYPKGSIEWKAEQERIQAQQRKDTEAEENIARAEKTAEAQKTGERYAQERAAVEQAGAAADGRILMGVSMVKDIDQAKEVIGLLGKTTVGSAFLNALSQGIQLGNVGSVSIPSVSDIAVQLSGDLAKLPPKERQAKIDAYHRLTQKLHQMALEYSRIYYQGQGAVTENERKIIKDMVGNINVLSPANMKKMAIALQVEANNAKEINDAWRQAKKTMTWAQFVDSKNYLSLKQKQFERAKKVLAK